MKLTKLLMVSLAATAFACPLQLPASAQAPTAAPRPRFQAPKPSPEVLSDGRVTFRMQAPKATEVLLNGQWPNGNARMDKDADGIWSVTVTAVPAGVWEYSFVVDGVQMIDPSNKWIKPMREPRTSILHIPGTPPNLYDFQDVPHGVVHQHTYNSKALGRLRELVVYTPPSYDKRNRDSFPTLYLQHGSGDNQATWTVHGKANWILDNLIAQKRAKEMVVVMMDGHAAQPGEQDNTAKFERDLFEDVMPFVEATYRVKKDAAHRAIVGLSMGGGQSLTVGLNHLDTFSWVGGFSAAAPDANTIAGAIKDPDATNKKLKLLWIGIGKDDFLLNMNNTFIALLKDKGIKYEWNLTEGTHCWPVWRGYLSEFVPKLF